MLKLFKKKKDYMQWNEYKKRIDFLGLFHWQQSVRKRNVHSKNTSI